MSSKAERKKDSRLNIGLNEKYTVQQKSLFAGDTVLALFNNGDLNGVLAFVVLYIFSFNPMFRRCVSTSFV